MPNRLARELSPYLLQHADNPVDWYPWGEEALARAREEDKPIFLSIGYAACHWCHVMEEESFRDEKTAALLNKYFVSIKVDREERPDLDSLYMEAVARMTGRGGWPMSVWLTPDGLPFYGGTYFPPEPQWETPSFRQVLEVIADLWKNQRHQILSRAAQIAQEMQTDYFVRRQENRVSRAKLLDRAADTLVAVADRKHGGWGAAPKFPQPMLGEFLLCHVSRTGKSEPVAITAHTLTAMAKGGIYDHLGGGFHRYSADQAWIVPHFEKMLYDNAQLARLYLHAWQATGEPLFSRVAEDTLTYLLRDMSNPNGGLYSSEDADSVAENGNTVEGAFYTWTPEEIEGAVAELARENKQEVAHFVMSALGVSRPGQVEGRSVLHRTDFPVTSDQENLLKQVLGILAKTRARRPRPRRDDKIITSWNGLALAALAEAGAALGRADFIDFARKTAEFILIHMRNTDGLLYRTWRADQTGPLGFLEDHAAVCEGLIALYLATQQKRWLFAAQDVARLILTQFRDQDGAFTDVTDKHERLFMRPRAVRDNAMPCGGSLAATALIRLYATTREEEYREAAERAIQAMEAQIADYPPAFGQWLVAMELLEGIPDSDNVAK